MIIRLIKIAIVLQIGLFALLVAYDNVIDYNTNYAFVRHVLAMDTTFPDNHLMDRAIVDPAIDRLGYAAIIAGEFVTGALCIIGALRLLFVIRAPFEFHAAKALAVLGLALGFTLWFFGFLTVGGEWFTMWQSATWNGQESAFRFLAVIGLALVFLCLPES
jgi:predicted small integral membrane protein